MFAIDHLILLAFGVAANLEGSGFLAIFVTGVIIGNNRFVFQRSTFLFHDGLAWLSQITMFVVLGLLVNPESLLDVWLEGLLIACVLVLLARPLAVAPVLKLFGFNRREIGLVSWVGLRGSVPIILAIFPLLYGLPGAALIFDVVFFVVLISATIQGSTLSLVARKLGLTEPPPAMPAAGLEITSLDEVDVEIVQYTLGDSPRAVGRRISQLALPDGTIVALVTRGSHVIPPRGSTKLQAGDHLFIVLRPERRPFVDCVFASGPVVIGPELLKTPLRLKGSTRVEEVLNAYGIALGEETTLTLEQLIRNASQDSDEASFQLRIGDLQLQISDRVDQRITTVSLTSVLGAEAQ